MASHNEIGPKQRPELLLSRPALEPRTEGDTIAFLFTDIESSIRRWEGEADAMAADLARHDKLLAQGCESHGGRVFSHTGDGLCAAFGTAGAAVAAAVAGQFALAEEAWRVPRRCGCGWPFTSALPNSAAGTSSARR